MTIKTECGADECDNTVFSKHTIKCKTEGYSFHLCKLHYEIYGKAQEYDLSTEILV